MKDKHASMERRNRCRRKSTKEELTTLEFWRAIIAECLATFLYVFLICSVNITWNGSEIGATRNLTVIALTNGFAMATLTQCFGHISGANVNPAVTCSFLITGRITIIRAILYLIAQCGGSIAGAALLYGVSVPGHQGALGISYSHDALGPGQVFGVEFILSFLIVFTIYASIDTNKKTDFGEPLPTGLAYLVCSLSGFPASGASMNPARTLGPAFVMNRWKHHWVYWLAPITGGMLAALIYHFIFDTKKFDQIARRTFYETEKESSNENDSEYDSTNAKSSNKLSTSGSGILVNSASSYSNSGSSNSSGYRTGHTLTTLNQQQQQMINSYDVYNRNSSTTIIPDNIGSAAYSQTMTLPSNNHHNATMATYASVYSSRYFKPKLDYLSPSNGFVDKANTKF